MLKPSNLFAKLLGSKLIGPFYVYFVLSWLIVNWRVFYIVLFGGSGDKYCCNGSMLSAFEFLEHELSQPANIVAFPLLGVAIFYVTRFFLSDFLVKWFKTQFDSIKQRIRERPHRTSETHLKEVTYESLMFELLRGYKARAELRGNDGYVLKNEAKLNLQRAGVLTDDGRWMDCFSTFVKSLIENKS